MSILKIMAEYECSPLWVQHTLTDCFEPVPIDSLQLSRAIKIQLEEWDLTFQRTYNSLVPQDSGFQNVHDEVNFDEKGIILWKKIINELKENYQVIYRSYKNGTTLYP